MTGATGAITVLRIQIDSHFHGSSDVPRPWVAQITGVDPKYGLARTFVQKLNDYRSAKRTCAGRMRGVVVAFPLHDGALYEISRLRGSSSKRYVAREFATVVDGEVQLMSAIDALAIADGDASPACMHRVADGVRIGRVDRLGTPRPCGFVIDRAAAEATRIYRLRIGALHEIDDGDDGDRRFVLATSDGVQPIAHDEAVRRLLAEAA